MQSNIAISPYVSQFEDFFNSKYKDEILKLLENFPEKKSIFVEFSALDAYDPELADALIAKPDSVVGVAKEAIIQMNKVTPQGVLLAPYVRFRCLPPESTFDLREINSEKINKFMGVSGVVTRVTKMMQRIIDAAFECKNCGRIFQIKQDDQSGKLVEPTVCSCERRNFQLLLDQCTFMDVQRAEIQEPLEILRGGEEAKKIVLLIEDDLTNQIIPGDKIDVTGTLRLLPPKFKGSIYDKYIDCNTISKVEREFEEIEYSEEDKKQILELSNDPAIYDKIIASVAPSVYGYTEIKEAIALQLFGGAPNKVKPDGLKIRPDMHLLLIGDPGCLVADERVALGNGSIVKIGNIGKRHLQQINVQVLTGEGGRKRDTATCFHNYPSQPVIEIITESGKSIKGTHNHPLLAIEKEKDRLIRKWKRLDEFEIGDRVAVVTSIPCTITKNLKTGFKPIVRSVKGGPHFHGKLPSQVTSDLAAFFGYVLGDGWVGKHKVGFVVAEGEQDILPKLCTFSKNLFAVAPKIYKKKRKGKKVIIYEGHLNSLDVAQNLLFLQTKRVPDLILQSGNRVAAAFLKWLFEADGTVFNKGRGRRAIGLKAKDIELLRDVQILLLRFGIHSRLVENALLIRRGESILKYQKHIGFVSKKKQFRLKELAKAAESFKRFTGQRSEKIVKIICHPLTDVYDIEVPKSHRFIANGIISHNTSKTQLLRYVRDLAPKGVYISGKSSTAAGVTASAEKDELADGGWTLKAGALVLASGGLACIDEFDKMDDEDRSSMHEAMENATISIAKAGMVATFRANTSILAAANPKYGRFDPYELPAEQFDIPVTLLSRFDLIFPMKDVLDESRDREMTDHILLAHRIAGLRAAQKTDKGVEEDAKRILPAIEPELLRKYISYAKKTVFPVLSEEAGEKIKSFYVGLRRVGEKQKAVPITARYLEAIVRLGEASAKGRLSGTVEIEDAERAIRLVTYCLKNIGVDPATGEIDVDIFTTGTSRSKMDKTKTVFKVIKSLSTKLGEAMHEAILEEAKVQGVKIEETEEILQKLKREGEIYSPKYGIYRASEEK